MTVSHTCGCEYILVRTGTGTADARWDLIHACGFHKEANDGTVLVGTPDDLGPRRGGTGDGRWD